MQPNERGAEGTELEIQILGQRYKATIIPESPYDPANVKLRA
jgi:dimethylglycine dehydrogenase